MFKGFLYYTTSPSKACLKRWKAAYDKEMLGDFLDIREISYYMNYERYLSDSNQ